MDFSNDNSWMELEEEAGAKQVKICRTSWGRAVPSFRQNLELKGNISAKRNSVNIKLDKKQ